MMGKLRLLSLHVWVGEFIAHVHFQMLTVFRFESPPVSFVLPFYLRRLSTGPYGIRMHSPVNRALGRWLRLRAFDVTLGRRYWADGELHSYLSGRCPLPPKFDVLSVPMARATYHFASGPTLVQSILRRCRARR